MKKIGFCLISISLLFYSCTKEKVDDICCINKDEQDDEYVTGRKFYYRIWLNNHIFYHGCGARIINYYKNSKGKWKKRSRECYVDIDGHIYKQLKIQDVVINCNTLINVYEADGKAKKSVQVQDSKMFGNIFLKDGDLTSTFKVKYNNLWYDKSLSITNCN